MLAHHLYALYWLVLASSHSSVHCPALGTIGWLFDLVKKVNILADEDNLGQENAEKILEFLKEMNAVLGVLSFEEETIPKELQEALEKRMQARLDKNWQEADRLRDYILERGYLIEDTPQGARLKKRTTK